MVPVVPMALTKWVTRPSGVAPDFGTGGFVVRQRVVGVAELVEHPPLPFPLQPRGQIARTLHAFFLAHQNQFGAVGPHRRPPLGALVFRHDQLQAVTLHRRDHRQRDAGIAAGRLDQHIAGPDLAARLGLPDHAQRRPVLDRTGGIVAFQFSQNETAGVSRQPPQPNQRGIANRGFERGIAKPGTLLHPV
jgi:hypothetical protein